MGIEKNAKTHGKLMEKKLSIKKNCDAYFYPVRVM